MLDQGILNSRICEIETLWKLNLLNIMIPKHLSQVLKVLIKSIFWLLLQSLYQVVWKKGIRDWFYYT